jgi:predicted signal transduction protein with EAL and GGDEF domain
MGHRVDLVEAERSGWLELWYQPKIDARAMVMLGAEGLLRVRHPSWGILPPAYFIGSDGDPRRQSVSEFVIRRAIDDWYRFSGERGPIEIAINLPMIFLQEATAVEYLCQSLPDHAAFGSSKSMAPTLCAISHSQRTSQRLFVPARLPFRSMTLERNGPRSPASRTSRLLRSRSIRFS